MKDNDITVSQEADLGEISPLGWIPSEELSYEDWESAMEGFFLAHRSLNWIIGDGLNFGEARYGEMYAQAIECTGWTYQRLADCKWVAGSVPIENRRDSLSWTHHRHVAKLAPGSQTAWLDRAEDSGWNTTEMHRSVSGRPAPESEDIHLIVKSRKRDAKRLFTEAASIVAAEGDLTAWGRSLTREELKDVFHEVFFLANTLANGVDHIYGQIEEG